MVIKRQLWVVISVVKKGAVLSCVLVWLKRGNFGCLLVFLKKAVLGGY